MEESRRGIAVEIFIWSETTGESEWRAKASSWPCPGSTLKGNGLILGFFFFYCTEAELSCGRPSGNRDTTPPDRLSDWRWFVSPAIWSVTSLDDELQPRAIFLSCLLNTK
jgi:hypothetical protein